MDITKLIPFNVRIKSLYLVRKEREINFDLSNLFSKIDNGEYNDCRVLLAELRVKWGALNGSLPEWFQLEYISQFSKAEAMVSILETDNI